MLLRAPILQARTQHLLSAVQRRERPRARAHALADQDERDHDPEGVHEHKVPPVVRRLGPRVREPQQPLVEQRRRVVEHVAVELPERDDDREGVAERVVFRDVRGGEEGEGTPCGLYVYQI